MNLPRSTFYKAPDVERQQLREQSDEALRRTIEHVLDDWPAYGYRRVTHELRRRGIVANHKRVARVMRAAQISAKRPRRFVKTTDSDHADPIYLNRSGPANLNRAESG